MAPQEFVDHYDARDLAIPSYPLEVKARRNGGALSEEELLRAHVGYHAMVSEVDHQARRILLISLR